MQRNEPDTRKRAEPASRKTTGGQPQPGDDEAGDEALEKPESTPSFLTARELQAREPAKKDGGGKPEAPQKQPGRRREDD